MKAIIAGKRYNTATAQRVAKWDNNYPLNDSGYEEETLFLTTKGSWFLDGEGGASSKYAVPIGSNERGGSGKITALTPTSAREWLEERQELRALEEFFLEALSDA
jgi:hypothetical protein